VSVNPALNRGLNPALKPFLIPTLSPALGRVINRGMLVALAFSCVFVTRVVRAQDSPPPAAPTATATDTARTHRGRLARHPALSIALLGIGTTVALRPLDGPITHRLRAPAPQRSMALRNGADVLNFVGGAGFIAASATLLGTGYLRHDATITQLGIRTSEAMIIGSIATRLLKGAFGRQRPFVDEKTPSVFAAGRGFTTAGRTSFPSGHTSSSFAFASALTYALHARKPKAARYVGPLLYGSAALVGVSRVYGANHWASDVAAGATVGVMSGWLVTRKDVDISAGSVRWRF